jgi:Domain of unknown function (DUF222)
VTLHPDPGTGPAGDPRLPGRPTSASGRPGSASGRPESAPGRPESAPGRTAPASGRPAAASGRNGAAGEPPPATAATAAAASPFGVGGRAASGFAHGGDWDSCPPSAELATALQSVSGAGWSCPGVGRDELVGLVRQWQALESWAAAGKLGVLRALIRAEDQPWEEVGSGSDPSGGWPKSLTHEVALALAMPPQSTARLLDTAWDLQARLPLTGDLLAGGELTFAKARAVAEALALLGDEEAAKAEALIAPELPGKTYGQAERIAVQAAITVDPESAARRREEAERNRARVALRRDPSGAASLAGYDLPTDETLAAHANVCARATQYQESGAFPRVRKDQLRALAYLDLMNGITAEARIASGQPPSGLGAPGEYGPDDPPPGEDGPHRPPSADSGADDPPPGENAPDDPPPGEDGPDLPPSADSGPGGPQPDRPPPADAPDRQPPGEHVPPPGQASAAGRPGVSNGDAAASGSDEPAPSPSLPPSAPISMPPLADLVLPLRTLCGLGERPGEGHRLGPLDPGLCRSLAASAARSPYSRLCVTVTDPDGIAIGHGCARPHVRGRPVGPAGPSPGLIAPLPARVNLTLPAACLPQLAHAREPVEPVEPGAPGERGAPKQAGRPGSWSFTPADSGPPGGYGTWTLTPPGGRVLIVKLEPVPAFDCDHRHESRAYQPNDTLRHLVQVRDYECTFPGCSRHARESDFEHAVPYDKGGRTCACNAGARSRTCHRVKQSPGWQVTQPRPGWHQWTTPAGRDYVQGPKRYPA